MKKIIVLIVLLFSAATIAQSGGWTDLMESNITVGNNNYDIFTNGYGNHIIVQETSSLKYYKMDVEGNTVSPTPITLESSAVISPSISGDATRLYIVYRKGAETFIRTKYSVDGGNTWLSLPDLTNASANSIESVVSKNNLHVTYQVGNQLKYSRIALSPGGSWTNPFTVSGTYTATNPRIGVWNAGSEDKVYFTYNNNNYLRWREYDLPAGSWSNVNWFIALGLGFVPENLGFAVDDTYLYSFWKHSNTSVFTWNLEEIETGNSSGSGNSNLNTYVDKIYSTTTANNKPYTAAWSTIENFPNRIVRMGFDGTHSLVYDEIHTEAGLTPVNIVNLSSAANDVHVIWKDNLSNNKLRYKYYDDIPLAPQDLAVESYPVGENHHPKLTWTLNNEPDVYQTVNAYEIQRRTRRPPGAWGDWSTIGYVDGDVDNYIDMTIILEGSGAIYQAEYRNRAIDLGGHISVWSNVVSIYFGTFNKLSTGLQKYDYMLSQNYPNPFNPSTRIDYSIKKDGLVTLKVYDILGKEVAALVNERKTSGNHSVEFNATNLPSGIYVYKLTTGKFTDIKKLILLK